MDLIKVVCLFFGFLILVNPISTIYAKNNVENVPFDVNQLIEQVTTQQKPHHTNHRLRNGNNPYRITKSLQGEFIIDTTRFFVSYGCEASAPSITFDSTNYFVVWGEDNWKGVLGTRVNQAGEILDKPPIKIATAYGDWLDDKPSVAYGAGVYLSVWSDYRSEKIFGARTSIEGVPLDTIPIPICTTYNDGYQPSVAFDGSNFLVVWNNEEDIIGARVNPAGFVLDTLGIIISNEPNDQYEPTVCFGGSNYFVAWTDDRSGLSHIYGTRVNPEGVVLDSNGIRIFSPTALIENHRTVATFGGNNYFVVWESSEDKIYGARIDQNGTVLDTSGIAIFNPYTTYLLPSVTFDGINYFVVAVWDFGFKYIHGTRIDTNGIVLDTGSIWFHSRLGASHPSIIFGGSNSFVVWNDYAYDSDILGARVNTAGIVLDTLEIPVSYRVGGQYNQEVAFDGTNYLAVWLDELEDGHRISGARITPTGVILDSIGIRISPYLYKYIPNLQVILGSTNYFVIWDDFWAGDIYGVRISLNGIILDTIPILISTAINGQSGVKGVFDGNNYFVVWADKRNNNIKDIYGTRVSSLGVVLDPDGIPISTANNNQDSAQVIFDGTNYFVCWQDGRIGSYKIYGARVSTSGIVLDTAGIPILAATHSQRGPQVAFDGTNYLLVWEDARAGYHIYGARVTRAGVVLDTTGIRISIANNPQFYPQVVFGDNKYFVIWDVINASEWDLYGARLTTEGLVLDTAGIPISTANTRRVFKDAAFDGAYYVVVWESSLYGSADIYGVRVNPLTGQIDSFVVSNQMWNQGGQAIAHGPGNQVFVTYSGWIDVYQSKSYYTYRIWGKFAPAPGVEETKISADIKSPTIMNSPNPFKNSTLIRYSVRKSGDISLKIFDITGKLVRNLINDKKEPGIHSITWDGSDDLNKKLPAGVYFYQLKTSSSNSETKELIILR